MTAVESSPVLLSMEIMFNYSWHIHTVLWHEHARECGTCVATGDWPNPLPTVTKQVQRDQKNTKKKKNKNTPYACNIWCVHFGNQIQYINMLILVCCLTAPWKWLQLLLLERNAVKVHWVRHTLRNQCHVSQFNHIYLLVGLVSATRDGSRLNQKFACQPGCMYQIC